jgi:hypothetical protein
MPNNSMLHLETIILSQMLVENLEQLNTKQKLKQVTKQFIKESSAIAEKDYNKVFGIDEQTTLSIIDEYERLVKSIASLDIPSKIADGQFKEAWRLNKKETEKQIHLIIKNS